MKGWRNFFEWYDGISIRTELEDVIDIERLYQAFKQRLLDEIKEEILKDITKNG